MELIAILISLAVERFLGSMEKFRGFNWFRGYAAWLMRQLASVKGIKGPFGVLAILLPPLLILLAIEYYLSGVWIVLGLAFSVLILLLSFGPCDLENQVVAYVDAEEQDDHDAANEHAANLIGTTPAADQAKRTQQVIEAALVQTNERMFAVLVWFMVLGPTGAVIYRLASELNAGEWLAEDSALAEAAKRLQAILDWPTARLCAIAYGFAGSFVDTLHAWRSSRSEDWQDGSNAVLIASGLGALGYTPGEEEEGTTHDHAMVHETLALIRRAVVVFVGIAAVFTLAGWLS